MNPAEKAGSRKTSVTVIAALVVMTTVFLGSVGAGCDMQEKTGLAVRTELDR